MQISAWFGKIDRETGSFLPAGDTDAMVEALLCQEEHEACPAHQIDLRAMAKDCGFVAGDREYNLRLREVAMEKVRRQLKLLVTAEQDLLLAVEALDDLSRVVNLLDERLYEWSRLRRQEIVHGKDLAEVLSNDAVTGELARTVLCLRRSHAAMEADVSRSVQSIAPNLSSLAGPILAARLISRSGGLRALAKMPSSRIQIIGAEKSLFKHLHGHAPSPKHGIIYRHPAVIGVPKRLRGKTARALAGKLAIAARLDSCGAGLLPDLKAALDRRLAEIGRSRRRDPSAKSWGSDLYSKAPSYDRKG
ncbi:MAG: putative NOP5 family protein [Methanosaeta sp. PtaB.Bin018]|jgi:nucleolar protein 56|nr:ATP-binding protein [Methanothrix sp.]OPX75893.1 MAG: putative NOP5 family protein [Methanosaeta sp. PtaB.Bin018]